MKGSYLQRQTHRLLSLYMCAFETATFQASTLDAGCPNL